MIFLLNNNLESNSRIYEVIKIKKRKNIKDKKISNTSDPLICFKFNGDKKLKKGTKKIKVPIIMVEYLL